MINVTQTFLPPQEEYQAILKQAWDSKWMTNRGGLCKELELKLQEYLGVENLLFVSNGTIALQIAIKALELKGEIITTPFSYVATTSSIVWEGCQPVFVDIDKSTLCIDANKIESAITEDTSAILATHVYGIPCDVEKIDSIAKKHNLKVIYDAAHCFGVKYKGKSILSYGDISTISFHATKLFHTGEGGGIVVNNKEHLQKVFYSHNFGHDGPEKFFGLGINGKNSELHAAMGLAVLPYMEEIITRRKEICSYYDQLLSGHTAIGRPLIPEDTDYNYAYYPIVFDSEDTLLKSMDKLKENQIFPRRYFYPSLNSLNYVARQSCEVSEDISRRVMCLPLYYDLHKNILFKITSLIEEKYASNRS